MNDNLKFEILALDTTDNAVIQTEINLLHSLLAHGILWDDPSLEPSKNLIHDSDLKVHVKIVEEEAEMPASLDKAFLINMQGSYERVEPLREKITEYINKQGFNNIYILVDDVSEKIARNLYPLIYKVENRLRAYLIRFMTTRLGPKWWEITATGDISKKVHQRKNNEQVFGPLVDNNAYLIDFGDLGRMIYSHSSGFTSKEDIINEISDIEETPEAIRELKEKLKSNYHKFFKDSFKKNKFQEKWENLEHIRHKVAHNNLFTESDLNKGTELAEELIEIIEEATKSIESITLKDDEREAIKESFVDQGYFDVIEEEEFLDELEEAQEHFEDEDGFVGLSYFVKQHLGPKGYDYSASYDVVSRLESKDIIEIYEVENPHGEKPTSAIRIAEDDEEA